MPAYLTLPMKRWYVSAFRIVRSWYRAQLQSAMALQKHPVSSTSEAWTTHDSNLALFNCLSQPIGKRPALPPEVILLILTHPSRWIRLRNESFPLSTPPCRPTQSRITHSQGNDRHPILTTRALSQHDAVAVTRAIFTFRSRD